MLFVLYIIFSFPAEIEVGFVMNVFLRDRLEQIRTSCVCLCKTFLIFPLQMVHLFLFSE